MEPITPMEINGKREIHIKKKYAEIMEINIDIPENILRVYCTRSPKMYDGLFAFQIRTKNPLKGRYGKGEEKNFLAHVELSIEEVEQILNEMKAYRDGTPSIFDRS